MIMLALPLLFVGCDKGATKYNITISNPAECEVSASASDAEPGQLIQLECTPRDGYELECFLVDEQQIEGGSFTMPKKNVTVSARATKITYTITYHIDADTTCDNPTTYDVETTSFQLRPAQKVGYTFVGWYRDSSLLNSISYVVKGSHGNLDLYPSFTKTYYAVTYITNYGENDERNQTFFTFDSAPLQLYPAHREGHEFLGWFTRQDCRGEAVEVIDPSIMQNITVYAKWLCTIVDSEGYRLITTDIDLETLLSDEANLGLKFRLAADIDAGGFDFSPFGSEAAPFVGEFDGAGHTISNLRISSTSQDVGLFCYVSGATIKNLKLICNFSATTQQECTMGGIVGRASEQSPTRIENCEVLSSHLLLSSTAQAYAGLIIGRANALTTITQCKATSSEAKVSCLSGYMGGISGFGGNITNCEVDLEGGLLEMSSKSLGASLFVGGITSYLDSQASVTDCRATFEGDASITALCEGANSTAYVGGIVGFLNSTLLSNCTATVSGLCARTSGTASRAYCGGVVGAAINAQMRSCYALAGGAAPNLICEGYSAASSFCGLFAGTLDATRTTQCAFDDTLVGLCASTQITASTTPDRSQIPGLPRAEIPSALS